MQSSLRDSSSAAALNKPHASAEASSSLDLTGITTPSSRRGPPLSLRPGDVAIVGMACRTAGGIDSPEKLWQFLLDKKDGSGEVPQERWEPWLRRDARNAKEMAKTLTKGYFIQDLENFDASFFGISPKEAEQMDPHQRLALELTWEALESAGIDPRSLAGSDTAVYMGIDSDDYSRLLLEDIPNIEPWMGIGTAPHGVPNRISYHLDLMGPSAAVDAACASSLVAVHMGRQAIANGESQVALVGGVNVLLAPALTRMLGKAGALSPEGICRSFDDAANGYARGEGGAVVVLKHLPSAVADGDNILAVLKGSAIAQDGKTNGIMAPNPKAQALVGRQALQRAGFDPLSVGYVEAHATSTSLGDPCEIAALEEVYGSGAGRVSDKPVHVGSLKPNVGHLEAAAGAIGLVKAVMSVNKGMLAPQARLERLNTKVDWDRSGLRIVREAAKWDNSTGPRRAAICSYGYGGTVSHAVIEEMILHPSPSEPGENMNGAQWPTILTLSSSQEKRLSPHAKVLADWLASPVGRRSSLRAIANTLAQRRVRNDYLAAFVVQSHDDAISALRQFVTGEASDSPSVVQGRTLSAKPSALWVFSGHGAQWKEMGKDLLSDPVFHMIVSDLDAVIKPESGFSAVEALRSGDLEGTESVQILTYVIQVGLSQVLRSRGIRPQAVIGHSVGEIAASVAAGCLTPGEGALIVTRRAKLYSQVRKKRLGGMALVNQSFEKTTEMLGDGVELVAAIDASPLSCVVSGPADAVDRFMEDMKARDIRAFRVKTDVAFHSPMLEQLVDPLRDVLAGALCPQPPVIPIYSTSSADPRSSALRDVDYWIGNMISPVKLRAAVDCAVDDGHLAIVEVSSHPVVSQSISETLSERGLDDCDCVVISIMNRDASPRMTIQQAIARLYANGVDVDFESQLGHRKFWCQEVPRTPWQHRPYYRQVATGPLADCAVHDVDKHNLLGQRISVASSASVLYTTMFDENNKPYPLTHPLDGTEIIPAAVYINTFHHATGAAVLSDIRLKVPLPVGAEKRTVQVMVWEDSIEVASSLISESSTRVEQTSIEHATAKWNSPVQVDPSRKEVLDVEAIKLRIANVLPNDFSVQYLSKIGVAGIAFPWQVVEHHGNGKEMMAKVDMNPSLDEIDWDAQSWGPLLDAATSVGSTIFSDQPKLRIVSQIDRVELLTDEPLPKVGYLHVEEARDAQDLAVHVSVLNERGETLARLKSMRLSDVEGAPGISGGMDSLVHHIDWVPPSFSETPRPLDQVVLVSEDENVIESYSRQLRPRTDRILRFKNAQELEAASATELVSRVREQGVDIFYIPNSVSDIESVSAAVEESIWQATSLVRLMLDLDLPSSKLFVITSRTYTGESVTGLAHGALYGLARIIASEHPDVWGGLLDTETPETFPILAVRYVEGHEVLRVIDGLPRRAVMRPLSPRQRHAPGSTATLLPRASGTYVVAGGLGEFGLATVGFLVERGAKRIVVVSRSGLPPRQRWSELATGDARLAGIVGQLRGFEAAGATVLAVALDLSAGDAAEALAGAISSFELPPVLGVVHAAGVLEDSLLLQTTRDSFARVLAPKVSGALALHRAFPPASLDFFVLYSSIGQLVGTAGQASYGSGNAFLDALAVHRRARGDNAVALQFTAIRGMGMATSTDILAAELESKGITDITCQDAFRAWEHVGKYDVGGAVVTRCLPVDEGSPAPIPLLDGVVVTRPRASGSAAAEADGRDAAEHARPTGSAELDNWLDEKIRHSIASVLKISDIDDIDRRTQISDLGVDSVMTTALRHKLQSTLDVKVPPTLTWNHPTVSHLVPWFRAKLQNG
ncbi:hypothetical protein HIM_06577 [Hirsutella minnesotensis 3608]|uniref:6-methylsalicylic acid synthase n=1 Tax=Hirsutella minnesotensis 3608 TaxID=1043627 RepID=A0A0F7ZU26_9HYPO|nr:hypothetical protein HIM_06577 [Hirsutella minnesotensis 3608]